MESVSPSNFVWITYLPDARLDRVAIFTGVFATKSPFAQTVPLDFSMVYVPLPSIFSRMRFWSVNVMAETFSLSTLSEMSHPTSAARFPAMIVVPAFWLSPTAEVTVALTEK